MTDLFSDKLTEWREYTRTPWARIRYAVVAEVLGKQAAELGEHSRVLDVGGGDGMDSIPLAQAGHEVTIVDPSASWLQEAQARATDAGVEISTIRAGLDDLPTGEWDLVLCHFVLRYRPSSSPDVQALARRVRPGGRLSVMDVNPAGRTLRALVNDGPASAMAEFHATRATVATFHTDARKIEADEVATAASACGLELKQRYGNRVANDLVVDNVAKEDPAYFADLLALELALHDREPYCRVGFAWQLLFER